MKQAVFSQYDVTIYSSTIAYVLSIILAIVPEDTMIVRKTKIWMVIAPAIINALTFIFVVIYTYFTGGWTSKRFILFFEETDILSFTLVVLFTTAIACVGLYFYIKRRKRSVFNDTQLMDYYLRVTDEQDEAKPITIVGGSMDFFGVRPCEDIKSNGSCHGIYKNEKGIKRSLENFKAEEKCKKCCLNNQQWTQIDGLTNNEHFLLQIVCTRPSNDKNGIRSKELLGYILKTWKNRDKDPSGKVVIRFFNKGQDENIRGRMITKYGGKKKVVFNLKTSNKANTYETPHTYENGDGISNMIIREFTALYENARSITDTEEKELISAFEMRK